jgi:hypothetical protein
MGKAGAACNDHALPAPGDFNEVWKRFRRRFLCFAVYSGYLEWSGCVKSLDFS